MADWYYAKSGQQFGPVSRMRIDEMARSGELRPSDLLWTESMVQWQPAGSISGIFSVSESGSGSPAVPGSPINPYAAPSHATVDGRFPGEIEPGSERLDLSAVVDRSFVLTTRHFGFLFLTGIVYLLIMFSLGVLLSILDSVWISYSLGKPMAPESVANHFQNGPTVWTRAISEITSLWLTLGLSRICLNLISGQPIAVAQMFGEGSRLVRCIIASIVLGVAVVIGLLLLVFPGIYLGLRFSQALIAIVDQDLSVQDAFRYSATITRNQKWPIFLTMIASIGITLLGVLAACAGLFFAIPMVMIMQALAYRWLQIGHRAVQDV
jgi:hypothetical protein